MTKREIEESRTDARWRSVVLFDTGSKVEFKSEWKPSHWDSAGDKASALLQARAEVNTARERYGIGYTKITLHRDKRISLRITETSHSTEVHSTHHPKEGQGNE